ncbi:MAG: hypothetical protein ABJO05_03490, partial [Roseibium sp.]
SSMNSFAQLLTVIDDNDYGVVPDLSCESALPHPDAVIVHNAVVSLDRAELVLPDDWLPMPELAKAGQLGAAATQAAMSGLTVIDEDGRRQLKRKASDLVRRLAIIGVAPSGVGRVPELRLRTNDTGQVRWFRRYVEHDVDCFGAPVERTYEVEDGWDFSRKRAKRGAYAKQFLSPDPVPVLRERGEYDILRACLVMLCEELDGKLWDHAVAPCRWSVSPWDDQEADRKRSGRRVLEAG